MPSGLWSQIPGVSEKFNAYSTGFIINGSINIPLDSVAIQGFDYAIQMNDTSWLTGDTLNIESIKKAGFFIAEPPSPIWGVTAQHAYIELNDTHLYNDTYPSGFYWFIVPAHNYFEIHANIRGYIQSPINSNPSTYDGRTGVFDIRRRGEIVNLPAATKGGIFRSHSDVINGGNVITNCKFEKDKFVVDLTFSNITFSEAITGNVMLDVPAIKTLNGNSWTADTAVKVYGYGYIASTQKFCIVYLSGQYNNLIAYDITNPANPFTITYANITDFTLLRLFGEYKVYKN